MPRGKKRKAVPWIRRLSLQSVVAEALIRFQTSPYEIFGRQSGTGAHLSPNTLLLHVSAIPSAPCLLTRLQPTLYNLASSSIVN